MKISILSGACAMLLLASATSIQAIAPVSIAVFPPDINIQSARGKQRIIVQASYADGITRDVTAQAKVNISDPKVAKIVDLEVLPVGDGKCSVAVEFEGKTTQVPVDVKDATKDRPISFKLDVMPIFLRNGCNQGGCHGAARGKDGFRLSLFGFDPDGDHYRLTRELNGRRINLAIPEESLLIEKSIGKVPHTGGQKFAVGEQYYNDLVRWVDAGGPQDPAGIPTPVSVDLYPKSALLDGKGSTQQLIVRAKYSDGSERDVTSLALFLSSNDSSGKVSPNGLVTAGDRGEAFVMARFSTFTVGVPFIVLPKDLKFSFPNAPEKNYIDTLVNAKLKNLRIAPSATCSDEVFLRRIFIDLTGMLPSVEEYKTFMANKSADKREQLVKELMERKEFSELWVLKWAELLQIRSSNQVSYKATLLYYNWLQDRIARNVPLNQWVQELLGANGGTFNNPVTNYYQNETDILKVTENVAQVFMGMRIQCAQCHNHPFDRWTMDDYYGFAAFFTQIGRKRTDDPRELVVFNSGTGEINHPVGGRRMAPKYLGGEVPDVTGKDRRALMAEWLASPKNPYFATNLANMVWTHFFGLGIINEVDDVRVSNPPSNSELLQELGKKFTEYNYDFKRLVKDIVLSNTYQLSTQTNPSNESDIKNFSHSSIRRIKAETFLDCISQVTETKNKFPGLPLGARAVQIADGQVSNYFLTTFGRATRESVCSCEVKLDPTLSQSLHLLNGDATTQRITQGNLVGKLLKEKKTPEEILDEIYIRCLSRMPSSDEKTKVLALVNAEKDKKQVLEDAFWAVLNTREYMFNH
ncbi:MAG: DUF1549 domain-containing protein [Planctomycetes bacterium]|nr:DUF1549 domain-containing protein [Planctomycetota bacterium]NBY03286.1 DUF1549 domain-containing protein [Planctomycetota bacterium]